MSKTAIEWTDETWNPVVGCTRVSEGCRNCYAFALHDMRHEAYKNGKDVPQQYAKPFTQIQLMPDRLAEPLSRKKPSMWFVNSMSDLFHKDVPWDFIDSVFATMYESQWHKFQILTKRPEVAAEYLRCPALLKRIARKVWEALYAKSRRKAEIVSPRDIEEDLRYLWPLPNVWIGTSVEDQASADRRIPELLKAPAAVRFLSMEPLLGPVDLRAIRSHCQVHDFSSGMCVGHCPHRQDIHWVIVGGESGPNARPMAPNWVREICAQCMEAHTPFFFKQWGEWVPSADHLSPAKLDGNLIPTVVLEKTLMSRVGKKAAGRLLDGREWSQFPEVGP